MASGARPWSACEFLGPARVLVGHPSPRGREHKLHIFADVEDKGEAIKPRGTAPSVWPMSSSTSATATTCSPFFLTATMHFSTPETQALHTRAAYERARTESRQRRFRRERSADQTRVGRSEYATGMAHLPF